jgi:hypothetical protein
MFIRSTLQFQILKRRSGLSRLISSEEKSQNNSSKISNFIKEFSQPILALATISGFIYYLGITHANLESEVKMLKTKLSDQADSGKIEKEKMEKVSAAEKEKIEKVSAAEKEKMEKVSAAEKEKMEKVLAAEKREIEAKLETVKNVSEARIRELETQIKYLSSK